MPSPNITTVARESVPQVSSEIFAHLGDYREAFIHAAPFKHVMMENFFENAFAERLLAEFPSFDTRLAINEMGNVGGKAVNTKIREISPAYQELYDMIGSQPFLDMMSRLSGIPDLLMDPKLYGGGTHDNKHGQELDAHVDFNYDEAQQLHRRLNVIVYMNKEWETEWGGAIEIHSNPWDHQGNRIQAFDPLFNRCVMFETNEYSWHGFPKINLPPEKRHISRKSISIYLYTRERPAEEIAPMHGTFYVQRPLPQDFAPGRTLTAEDIAEFNLLLKRRDDWLRMYHKMELTKNREIADKSGALQDLLGRARVPLTGYVLQKGISGVFPDAWTTSHAEIEVQPLAETSGVLLRGWRPDNAPSARLRMTVGDQIAEATLGAGSFEVPLRFASNTSEPFRLKIETESSGPTVDPNADSRDLVFVMSELRAQHPLVSTLKKMLG